MLQSMGSQRIRHNLATEQQQYHDCGSGCISVYTCRVIELVNLIVCKLHLSEAYPHKLNK